MYGLEGANDLDSLVFKAVLEGKASQFRSDSALKQTDCV